MNRPPFATAIAVLVIVGWSPSLFAQAPSGRTDTAYSPSYGASADTVRETGNQPTPPRPPNALGVWIGGSVYPGGLFGNLPNGSLSLLGLRYSRRLLADPGRSAHGTPVLTFTFDLIPAAWLFIPEGTPPGALSPRRPSVKDMGLSTLGIGAYPLGLKLRFRSGRSLQPFVAGQTGILYFLDPFPDARGRRLNFATGLGGGFRLSLASGAGLTVGYQYHHLSNGFRALINPGLDGNVFYLGFDLAP